MYVCGTLWMYLSVQVGTKRVNQTHLKLNRVHLSQKVALFFDPTAHFNFLHHPHLRFCAQMLFLTLFCTNASFNWSRPSASIVNSNTRSRSLFISINSFFNWSTCTPKNKNVNPQFPFPSPTPPVVKQGLKKYKKQEKNKSSYDRVPPIQCKFQLGHSPHGHHWPPSLRLKTFIQTCVVLLQGLHRLHDFFLLPGQPMRE